MSLKHIFSPVFLTFFAGMLIFSSCKKDDDDQPMGSTMADFDVTIENVLPVFIFRTSGAAPESILMPGETTEFTFNAGMGSYLSLASMFGQSNDLFYAFDETGLALYDVDGNAVTGDVTGMIDLWDAGTEVNEEPGVGPNQAPRQSGPNTGDDEGGTVQRITDVNDGFTYPADEDVIMVSIAHDGGTEFTVSIENVSATASVTTPLAPGVFVIHGDDQMLFETGAAAPDGLEGLAEDANNSVLMDALTMNSGYTSPLAPGVWVVHESGIMPIFTVGEVDRGDGLEGLAEDADPSSINGYLGSAAGVIGNGVFNTPDGASGPGPLFPGETFSFSFEAEDGDYLSFASMLGESNDLFVAFGDDGIALFQNGVPISGDQSGSVTLWDAGTEVNEYPGAGNNQAPRQAGPDSGMDESIPVETPNDGFTYPAVSEIIKVTISSTVK